jgi:hypothetical protein
LSGIDAVVISHDHYDHLDEATIRHLGAQGTRFFVPLGLGLLLGSTGGGYIVGLAKNARLKAQASRWEARAEAGYESSGKKQRLFADLRYGARSWSRQRRVHRPPGARA